MPRNAEVAEKKRQLSWERRGKANPALRYLVEHETFYTCPYQDRLFGSLFALSHAHFRNDVLESYFLEFGLGWDAA